MRDSVVVTSLVDNEKLHGSHSNNKSTFFQDKIFFWPALLLTMTQTSQNFAKFFFSQNWREKSENLEKKKVAMRENLCTTNFPQEAMREAVNILYHANLPPEAMRYNLTLVILPP